MKTLNIDDLIAQVKKCPLPGVNGTIVAVTSTSLKAILPNGALGMQVHIFGSHATILAEVVGCSHNSVTLLAFESTTGIAIGDSVQPIAQAAHRAIQCGDSLLGRIISPTGEPLDEKGPLLNTQTWALTRPAPNPLKRQPITKQLITGIRTIDGMLAIGTGQRLGLFAGPGQGKSTLLGTLAKNSECDISVVCLLGERGREVRSFIENILGPKGLARSVVVLATADSPILGKVMALETATAIAEWFRGEHKNVLLLVDSLTRYVRAKRDIANSLGQSTSIEGYCAGAFEQLPSLIERTCNTATGSITAIYTVLTEGNIKDPAASEIRSLLDGHIVLSGQLAESGHWPAIDVSQSVSRVMPQIVPPRQLAQTAYVRRLLSAYKENKDLILMGAYKTGMSKDTDAAIKAMENILSFLKQDTCQHSSLDATLETLNNI